MLQSHQFKNKMDCSLHLIIYQDLSGAKPSKTGNLSVHSANRLLKISRENIFLGSLSPLGKTYDYEERAETASLVPIEMSRPRLSKAPNFSPS